MVRITYSDLSGRRIWPAGKYDMWALGGEGLMNSTLEMIFGPYDPTEWRCFRWLPRLKRYVELSEEDYIEEFLLIPDRSFWLIQRSVAAPEPHPPMFSAMSTQTDEEYEITLEEGWNMIANPFFFPVPWDSSNVNGIPIGEAEGSIVDAPVTWNVDGYEYDYTFEPRVLEDLKGYWIYNWKTTPVVCRVPPYEFEQSAGAAGANTARQTELGPRDGWRIEIRADVASVRDFGNYAGVAAAALPGRDRSDRPDPPLNPTRALSVYFPHADWGNRGVKLRADMRDERTSASSRAPLRYHNHAEPLGHVWYFDIAKNFSTEGAGDKVSVEFIGIEGVPDDVRIIFIDREMKRCIDLRTEDRYEFFLGERGYIDTESDARFMLLAGNAEFVDSRDEFLPRMPTASALYQSYPNPFNPATVIRYDLAYPGYVDIRIYDVGGALVKVVENRYREPGRYEVGWNGNNERGNQVASGIYFYRLKTVGCIQTRKMVLIR